MKILLRPLIAAFLLIFATVISLRAQEEAVAVKSSLEALEKEQRDLEAELKQAIGNARAIQPDTLLKEREASAKRILDLLQKLANLNSSLEAERKKIAAIVEYDWHVVKAEGWGYHAYAPGQQDPLHPRIFELERKEGREEWAVKIKRGDGPRAVIEEYRKIIEQPVCYPDESYRSSEKIPLSQKQPHFWEKLDITSAGPFQTQADAEKRRREPAWNVVARQNSVDANETRKRYGCSVQTPQGVTVVDVEGLDWKQAQQKLETAGFVPDLTGGDPPRSPAEGNKVQWQKPKAGQSVALGSKVQIAIRPPYVEPKRSVPDVAGLGWKEAEGKLRAAGFTTDLRGGDPAPTRAQESTVLLKDGQKPVAGTMLAPGEKVTVIFHTAPRRLVTVPDVRGLRVEEARTRLELERFIVTEKDLGPAPTRDQEFRVHEQQPHAKSQIEPGQQVVLERYSRARTTDPPPPVVPPRVDLPVTPPPSDQAQQTITFEERRLSGVRSITTQYSDLGITFSTEGGQVPVLWSIPGHGSYPNGAANFVLISGQDMPPLMIYFAQPFTGTVELTLWVHDNSTYEAKALGHDLSTAIQVVYVTHAGAKIDEWNRNHVMLSGAGISRIRFAVSRSGLGRGNFAIDDIRLSSTKTGAQIENQLRQPRIPPAVPPSNRNLPPVRQPSSECGDAGRLFGNCN